LPPRAIAERKGLPDATVRSHLKRGLDRLRERFDADHRGDRAAWIALLQPLALWKPATVVLPGLPGLSKGLLMSTKAKITITAALAALLGATLLVLPWRSKRDESTAAAKPADAAGTATRTAAASADDGRSAPTVAASPLPPTRSSTPQVHFVYGAIV